MRKLLTVILGCTLTSTAMAQAPVQFEVKLLTVDANEGCTIGDFDGDGKLDVSAGRNWYRNGDWAPRPVRHFADEGGYVHNNAEFAFDVDGDGLLDIIAGDFFTTKVNWYKNPGEPNLLRGYQWEENVLVDTGLGSNEGTFFQDINGDGQPEWITNSWVNTNPLVVWTLDKTEEGKTTLKRNLISEQGQQHGFGFGDVNNDGRTDILTGAGWFEAPESNSFEDEWIFHPDWSTTWSVPVLVRDINGDGLNDIIIGNPHDYGLFVWFGEGVGEDGKMKFREVTIDKSYSQLHALHFADLDGDGRDELITGKRVRAHNDGDPGAADPAIICYYTINEKGEFTKHVINEGQVGIGLQIRTADFDGDGRIDILVAGKDGTQILFNRGVAKP